MGVIRIKVFEENMHEIEVPKWWQNFCDGTNVLDSVDDVNLQLMDWSAQFWIARNTNSKFDYGDRYLDFYDEQAYSWFMLRWSV